MPTDKRAYRLIATVLTLSLLLTGCEVPDISKFTEQSAEMTRGIRTGVKDTEGRIRAATERTDLYSGATIGKLRKGLKDYQAAVKPTVAALDALDGYLEALNALSQANKKSGENATAAVTSVTNLVTAVSGFTFAGSVVDIAAGVGGLAEQFRTAKGFRTRVTLAAQIVEGVHPKTDERGKPLKGENGQVIYERRCKGDAAERLFLAATKIKEMAGPAASVVTDEEAAKLAGMTDEGRRAQLIKWRKITKEQAAELAPLTPEERRQRLARWGHISEAQYAEIVRAEKEIKDLGCGVIDLLKFNVRDLKEINLAVSQSIHDNAREKNRTVLGFYDSLVSTDRRIQNELETILNYKTLAALIREEEALRGDAETILVMKRRLKEQSDNLFIMDGPLRLAVTHEVEGCGPACGRMKEYLEFDLCDTCRDPLTALIRNIPKPEFDRGVAHVEAALETRAAVLYEENAKYLDDLERITPSHTAVVTELNAMKSKGNQIDALFDSSLSALDTWAETHANLRVAVNTKKPLTVSRLASKVREIWGIINPEAE